MTHEQIEKWGLAEHEKYGRVIVTAPTPDRYGNVYFVIPDGDHDLGYEWRFCEPDKLTYLDTDQKADTSDAMPPNTLTVGSKWSDADALTRACEDSGHDQITVIGRNGDVCVWDAHKDDWRDHYRAIQDFAPFTIIHGGK